VAASLCSWHKAILFIWEIVFYVFGQIHSWGQALLVIQRRYVPALWPCTHSYHHVFSCPYVILPLFSNVRHLKSLHVLDIIKQSLGIQWILIWGFLGADVYFVWFICLLILAVINRMRYVLLLKWWVFILWFWQPGIPIVIAVNDVMEVVFPDLSVACAVERFSARYHFEQRQLLNVLWLWAEVSNYGRKIEDDKNYYCCKLFTGDFFFLALSVNITAIFRNNNDGKITHVSLLCHSVLYVSTPLFLILCHLWHVLSLCIQNQFISAVIDFHCSAAFVCWKFWIKVLCHTSEIIQW
jgi:hypothetical protein